MATKKIDIPQLKKKVDAEEKLVMVTAYDYPTAKLVDEAVDMILVGDSLGNVVLGYDTTIPVTMDDIIHHTRPVMRAVNHALVVADMPFGSYQVNTDEAVRNALRLIKEGGADAVKLEGGSEVAPLVAEMTKRGIPVMAHIGLLPQTASLWEGYRSQGRDEASAWQLVDAAQSLEEAGAFSVVLECVTAEVAGLISEKVDIPTIGIGSGPLTDGQVLVFHDLTGLNTGRTPRFVKKYANIAQNITDAINAYAADVRAGQFPADEHSFPMDADEVKKLY